MMVGRSLSAFYNRSFCAGTETLLSVEGLSKPRRLRGCFLFRSQGRGPGVLQAWGGEKGDHGVAFRGGLFRQWRDLAQRAEGQIQKYRRGDQARPSMVPEDRKRTGLVMSNSVGFNLTLAALRLLAPGPFVSLRKKNQMIERFISQLNIKTNSPWTVVAA